GILAFRGWPGGIFRLQPLEDSADCAGTTPQPENPNYATRANLPKGLSADPVRLRRQHQVPPRSRNCRGRGTEGDKPSTRLAAYPSGRRRSSPETLLRSTRTEG